MSSCEKSDLLLQENDTADIAWDAFALPELNNFLVILKREEEEHVHQVRLKFQVLKDELANIIRVKSMQSEGVSV
jgi:hypothetical protein